MNVCTLCGTHSDYSSSYSGGMNIPSLEGSSTLWARESAEKVISKIVSIETEIIECLFISHILSAHPVKPEWILEWKWTISIQLYGIAANRLKVKRITAIGLWLIYIVTGNWYFFKLVVESLWGILYQVAIHFQLIVCDKLIVCRLPVVTAWHWKLYPLRIKILNIDQV